VDQQPRGLVDREDVGIAVEHLEGRRGGRGAPDALPGPAEVGEAPLAEEQRHSVPRLEPVLGRGAAVVHHDLARAEELEHQGEGGPREVLADEPIDALSGVVPSDRELEPGHGRREW